MFCCALSRREGAERRMDVVWPCGMSWHLAVERYSWNANSPASLIEIPIEKHRQAQKVFLCTGIGLGAEQQ